MSTILLVWYSSGWVGAACWALRFERLTLFGLLGLFAVGPVGALTLLFGLAEQASWWKIDPVLWRKP